MEVFCTLRFYDLGEPSGLLEIKIDFPIAPYPGLNVQMPFPKSWVEISGGFSGEITEVFVVGQQVRVFMEVRRFSVDESAIQELRAIGYKDEIDDDAAWRSLEREPLQ